MGLYLKSGTMLNFIYRKLTEAWVKSWVKPGCGLVLVVDVVNFSL